MYEVNATYNLPRVLAQFGRVQSTSQTKRSMELTEELEIIYFKIFTFQVSKLEVIQARIQLNNSASHQD